MLYADDPLKFVLKKDLNGCVIYREKKRDILFCGTSNSASYSFFLSRNCLRDVYSKYISFVKLIKKKLEQDLEVCCLKHLRGSFIRSEVTKKMKQVQKKVKNFSRTMIPVAGIRLNTYKSELQKIFLL